MSKFLSLLLRHRPEEVELALEPGAWAPVDELIAKAREHADAPLDRRRLLDLLESQPGPRFELDDERDRIRARYGHSVDVELELEPAPPPEVLLHGTAGASVVSILEEGLRPRSRRFVHLSEARGDALEVGSRHGTPVVLEVRAREMAADGFAFYPAAPGVWLTGRVPPAYLAAPEGSRPSVGGAE